MMDVDSVNMSLDDIIKQNKIGKNYNQGGGRNFNQGNRNQRGRSQTRAGTPGGNRNRSRSRSQSRQRSRSRQRSQSRSQSQPRSRSNSRSRSRSRTRFTPRQRAGLEDPAVGIPALVRVGNYRGGYQNQLRRSNSQSNLWNNGNTQNQWNNGNKQNQWNNGNKQNQRNNGNRQNQRNQNYNKIHSQTFTRSRSNLDSDLTVSVANNFAKKRFNGNNNSFYLNKNSLHQLNNQYGYQKKSGPGSVKSMGSHRSNNSNRSNRSNYSNRSMNSARSYNSRRSNHSNNSQNYSKKRQNYSNQSQQFSNNRQNYNNNNQANYIRFNKRNNYGRQGVSQNFVQILNPKLQKEIATIQERSEGAAVEDGVLDFSPTPSITAQTLHQRFAAAS